MSQMRFVPKDGLTDLVASLSASGRVLVPVVKPATAKPSIVYEEWEKGKEFTILKATVPPRDAVMPESEILLTFRKVRNPEDLNDKILGVQAEPKGAPTIIFGSRPCDARGIDCTDKPYMQGLFKDPYYTARRNDLTIISLTCNTGCETCFCHWLGGGPTSPIGSDILLTEVEGGYVLQAVTEKGSTLLDGLGLAEAGDKGQEMFSVRKKAWESLVPAPDVKNAPQSLKSVFSNVEFWTEWTDRCISCGACTYFCPTCYCFNITDEGEATSEKGGRRLRSWDNCMSSRYTREASGHNPRPKKYERMRNRVSHKFWTFFENWGTWLCTGCGRCITNCPVHLDIRAITLAAINTAERQAMEQGKNAEES